MQNSSIIMQKASQKDQNKSSHKIDKGIQVALIFKIKYTSILFYLSFYLSSIANVFGFSDVTPLQIMSGNVSSKIGIIFSGYLVKYLLL